MWGGEPRRPAPAALPPHIGQFGLRPSPSPGQTRHVTQGARQPSTPGHARPEPLTRREPSTIEPLGGRPVIEVRTQAELDTALRDHPDEHIACIGGERV